MKKKLLKNVAIIIDFLECDFSLICGFLRSLGSMLLYLKNTIRKRAFYKCLLTYDLLLDYWYFPPVILLPGKDDSRYHLRNPRTR